MRMLAIRTTDFRSIGSFAGRAKLSTWLGRIVINEAIGRKRRGRAFAFAGVRCDRMVAAVLDRLDYSATDIDRAMLYSLA